MGIFSTINESVNCTMLDYSLDNVQESCHDDFTYASLHDIAVCESNMNRLFSQMGIEELRSYEESGDSDLVYVTEGAFSGIIAKIKAFLISVWNKIKAIFKKFMSLIDSFTKSDKDFLNKYRTDLAKAETKDFKFKGYKFTLEAVTIAKVQTETAKIMGEYDLTQAVKIEKALNDKERVSDVIENMYSNVGGSGVTTHNELAKHFFETLRSGNDSKEEIDVTDSIKGEIIKQLDGSKDERKKAKKEFDEAKKAIDRRVKELTKIETTLAKNFKGSGGEVPDDEELKNGETTISNKYSKDGNNITYKRGSVISAIGVWSKLLHAELEIIQLANGCILTASKDYSRQCKAVLVKLLSYKPKNESAWVHNESADDSFLGNVLFD